MLGSKQLLQRARPGLQKQQQRGAQQRQLAATVHAAKGFGAQLKQKFAPKDYLK